MKIGIVGFSGSGKSTVFRWLTGVRPDPSKSQTGQTGIAKVPDPRLDWLAAKFQPRKVVPAAIDFLDTPGLLPGERRDNPRRLGILREANGLAVVLNGFGDGDPAGQLRRFRDELVFADLEVVTNRISRLDDQLRKPRPAKQKEADERERELLRRIAGALEANQSPAALGLKGDDEKAVRSFQLLTLKPEQVLLSVGDEGQSAPLPADLLALASGALRAPARLEIELMELPQEDRHVFMQDLGVREFVQGEVLRATITAMGQIVFFTVGYDECRAWPMPDGGDAVVAAGQIHTDLARGFIRAKVLAYADFQKTYKDFPGRVGESMKEAQTQALLREEGKSYVVKDGDIVHILAST